MSAPEFQAQDQVRTAPDNTVKFKEGWKMKVATKASKIKMVISRGLATQRPVKLVGILALGGVLLAATGLNFTPGHTTEEVNRSTSINAPRGLDGPPDDAWRFDSPFYEDFRASKESSPSSHQQRVMDSREEKREVEQVIEEGQDYQESMANSSRTGGEVPFDERYPFGILTEEQMPEGRMPTKETLDREDVVSIFGGDVVAALGYELLAAKLGHYQADGSLTSRDLERLDQEIDMLMMAAADSLNLALSLSK